MPIYLRLLCFLRVIFEANFEISISTFESNFLLTPVVLLFSLRTVINPAPRDLQ